MRRTVGPEAGRFHRQLVVGPGAGSVFNAYVARQASEVDPAGDAYMRAVNRLRRARTVRGARRAFRAVIRADKRINRALNRIETDMEPLAASSDPGTTARREALMELRGWRLANRLEMKVAGSSGASASTSGGRCAVTARSCAACTGTGAGRCGTSPRSG
jgi:hypothetical protein